MHQHLTFPEPALKSIVNKYRWVSKYSAGLDLDDLAQVGREAVETSKLKFDPERGGKSFVGFAWMCAAQAIHKFANEHRAAVRVPCDAAHGRGKRIVAYTNSISPQDRGISHARRAAPDHDGDMLSTWGFIAEANVESDLDTARTIARVRACIDVVAQGHPTRGLVLAAACLEGRSHASIAAELGVTRQAVTQALTYALVDFKRAWFCAGWELP